VRDRRHGLREELPRRGSQEFFKTDYREADEKCEDQYPMTIERAT
jgi:hypothetical protein